jgi:hypothetical protein
MEQKGYVSIIPAKEKHTAELETDNEKRHLRGLITEMLGLSVVEDIWVQVKAIEESAAEKGNLGHTAEWVLKEPDGSSGVVEFPRYLPALLFAGKKEGETIRLNYADIDIVLTLKQLASEAENSGSFEEVFQQVTDGAFNLDTPEPAQHTCCKPEYAGKKRFPGWVKVAGVIIAVCAGIGLAASLRRGK